ncbi:hypothetical protein AB5N19_10706 [Seiridium cardinale]
MKSLRLALLGLSWFVRSSSCVGVGSQTDEAVPMTLVKQNQESHLPVWIAIKQNYADITTIDELYLAANKYFNWVKTQGFAETGTGSCLIAAGYSFTRKTMIASTIPRGAYKRRMYDDGELARVWQARTEPWDKPEYHAEDSVYYQFESKNILQWQDSVLPGWDPSNARYSDVDENFMIAVYGSHGGNIRMSKGRATKMCGPEPESAGRTLSCQQMATSLGAGWIMPEDLNPAQEAEDDDPNNLVETADDPNPQDACVVVQDPPSAGKRRIAQENLPVLGRTAGSVCTFSTTITETALDPSLIPTSSKATGSSSNTASASSSTITSPPAKPSCVHQDSTPGNGASSPFCVCDKTITLPELSQSAHAPVSQSCAYTALSTTTSKAVNIQTSTYTVDCQACTGVGGVEHQAQQTCTTIAGCILPTPSATPSMRIWLSNNTISVGTANNAQNGSSLLHKTYDGARALCQGHTCTSTKNQFTIPDVATVIHNSAGEGRIDDIGIGFTISIANFSTVDQLDQMLARGIAAWQQATAKSCNKVAYREETTDTCKSLSPIRRDQPELFLSNVSLAAREEEMMLRKRSGPSCERAVAGDCAPPSTWCDMETTLCSGPDAIVINQGDNVMLITVSHVEKKTSAWDKFICGLIEATITVAVTEVAPELLELEVLGDVELEVTCEEILAGITQAQVAHLTGTS